MFAIRDRRKVATEKDFLDAVEKVIKGYAKFSATPRYMTHNWGRDYIRAVLTPAGLDFE